jgi:putative transposase
MVAFIDDNRGEFGVEPICEVLPIAPSTYYAHKAGQADPDRRSARAKRDERLKVEIARVFADNYEVYGHRKVWAQLRREGFDVARCTVQRLMRELGLRGAVPGRAWKTTTPADTAAGRPSDLVDRQFAVDAPNRL